MTMHFWNESWDLDVAQCPCDRHFLDFLAERGIRESRIFHFGTGSHHLVGIATAEDGSNNAVLGITASPAEYEAYVRLSIDRPKVVRSYKAFFGDIYQLDVRLLPEFDVATLFHLCEFRTEANDAYGAMTDLELAKLVVGRIRPGGWLLFYMGSNGFAGTEPVIERLVAEAPVRLDGEYKSLRVYRKMA